jgi:hypothetical protein
MMNKNHLGEKVYVTKSGWMRALRKQYENDIQRVAFYNHEGTSEAWYQGLHVGAWDDTEGTIFTHEVTK